jgi:hypothetical protein
MSALTFFYQNCPVCGRSLRISAKYFGRQMSCTHCQGEFRAGKEELPAAEPVPEAKVPAPVISRASFVEPQLGEV